MNAAANDRAAARGPALARHWVLREDVNFLNHGSFGACPRAVLEKQSELRARMEAEPVDFLAREFDERLDRARAELAAFVGADPGDLAFVANATSGVNAVLRSLAFAPGDEILVANFTYPACHNAAEFAAERSTPPGALADLPRGGGRVVVATIPFPLDGPETVVQTVLARVSPRTRLAMLDHITSPTALILPIQQLVRELAARGVDTLVDGAHAPGMVPLRLTELGAAYYTGNCHKWLCAPKGAGFLVVRPDRRERLHPTVISHGLKRTVPGRSRYHLEFDWTGTHDPTPFLCVPEAIRFVGSLLPGGWPAVMAHNHALAVAARDILARALDLPPPCPDEMLGSMAALPLPLLPETPAEGFGDDDPLHLKLRHDYGIEVPVFSWTNPPGRYCRISAQLYNSVDQYHKLAAALRAELGA